MTEFCSRLDWVSIGLGFAAYCALCLLWGFARAAIKDWRQG